MMRRLLPRVFLALLAAAAGSLPAAHAADATAPDYGDPASWICRPGNDAPCTSGLDAATIDAAGNRRPQPFKVADAPAIDCFYVYPTASLQRAAYADMTASPELVRVTKAQVGRLSSRCRVFAPIYRQMTMMSLARAMSGQGTVSNGMPYADVLAAWNWYLQHDNQGRGVVLIGHSQGTMLLQRLIAREIDGTPVQARLVSAILAGDHALAIPRGAQLGGTFKSIPVCAAADQTGCAYAFGSYAADDPTTRHFFGHDPGEGMVAACASPAAPSGGSGTLKTYLPRPESAPASDPPWIELVGQLEGECRTVGSDRVFVVSVLDSRDATTLRNRLGRAAARPGWGLHRIDLNLVQGNILDVLDAEIAAWLRRGPPHA